MELETEKVSAGVKAAREVATGLAFRGPIRLRGLAEDLFLPLPFMTIRNASVIRRRDDPKKDDKKELGLEFEEKEVRRFGMESFCWLVVKSE